MSIKAGVATMAMLTATAALLAACSSSGGAKGSGPTTGGAASGGGAASSGAASSGAPSGGAAGSTPTSMSTVTVGTSGATAAYGPIYVGAQQGIFKKHGINLKIQTLTPNSVTAAVLSGNIDIAFDGPNLASGILSNPSAKIDGTPGPTVFYIYARKGINTVKDLKGKTIAVTTPGGSLDTSVRLAIEDAGMKPGTDVKIAYLQTNSAALAATETGSVQAAGVSPPTSVQAQQAGLVQVENITKFCPLGLMAVNNKFAKNKTVTQEFMDALKEATALAVSSNADSNAALKQYVKISNQAQLDGSWQGYKDAWVAAPYPTDAMKQVLQQLSKSNPPVKGAATANPDDLIDNSFINAAK